MVLRGIVQTLSRPDEPGAIRSLFFNRIWLYGAALVGLLGVVTQTTSIAVLGALILASAGVSKLWNRTTLRGIEFRRELDRNRAFPDDQVTLVLTVTNRKPLPVPSFRFDEELADCLLPVDQRSTIDGSSGRRVLHLHGSLRPYEQRVWRVPVRCQARGAHQIGPATLRSGDPFGFFSSRTDDVQNIELVVYPNVHAVPDLTLPNQRPLGDRAASRTVITDPLRVSGVREYRPEDPFRAIHWKATARHSAIQVKIQEPVTTLSMTILLNLDTFTHFWEGLDIVSAEQSIEVAASYAEWALRNRFAVGLRANGVLAGSDQTLRVPAGRGSSQRMSIMTGLARLRPYSTVPFARTMAAALPSIPLGSTILVITPMMSEAIEAVLASMLVRGRQTVLVPLASADIPNLPTLMIEHPEFVAPTAGVKAAAA